MIKDPQYYWNNKLTAYLHDPVDKVFCIKRHEDRAADFLDALGVQTPNKKPFNEDFRKQADVISAGIERGQLPSYSVDENKNGAVDFSKYPEITHPIAQRRLKIELPEEYKSIDPSVGYNELNDAVIRHIEKELDDYHAKTSKFRDRESSKAADEYAQARFFYTHLLLRFTLAQKDVGGIGALWHRIPADSRFPDHSIWQHNALTSAIYSCMESTGEKDDVGLMVFSITPVQPFIAKARKLRDYWTGSVLLSWLAFEGIRWVMENLGPDHIVYPSLIDQPLVIEYLKKQWDMESLMSGLANGQSDIASFPNKFLFITSLSKAEEIGKKIQDHIQSCWDDLSSRVESFFTGKMHLTGEKAEKVKEIFKRQTENYWDLNYAAVKLIGNRDIAELKKLFDEKLFKEQKETAEKFKEMLKENWTSDFEGIFYSLSHRLAQRTLASQKGKKENHRHPEPGEKCPQCGEFEVLHDLVDEGFTSAKVYSESIKKFWKEVSLKIGENGSDFKEHEKLCTICLIKRIASRVLSEKRNEDHILHTMFKDKESYPSTTEIALHEYYIREHVQPGKKRDLAQKLYDAKEQESPLQKLTNHDAYYAILMMDGDKMGQLVNGVTLSATWESVMHSEIVTRLKENKDFSRVHRDAWNAIFTQYDKKILTPATHAAISEALGDFAIYGVKPIVKKHHGTLIYAGGDDVCAVMPTSTVIRAAKEIARYYNSFFNFIGEDGEGSPISDTSAWRPEKGKLSINLGVGEKISISAGILICHHKESLSAMIARSHELLSKYAKKKSGRNACAIELRKRSGGSRYFSAKWKSPSWDAFINFDKQISQSLVYRLEMFRNGFEAILASTASDKDDQIRKLILMQLKRSLPGTESKELQRMSKLIQDIIIVDGKFKPEGLIIASYMQKERIS